MYELNVCVLTSGIHWQLYGWRHIGYEPYLVYYKDKLKTAKFDVIIVPKGIHGEYFSNNSGKLLGFVRNGGILITFGELSQPWIPGCEWEITRTPRKVILKKSKLAQILKCGISCLHPNDFESWTAASHGHFRRIPSGATPLVTSDANPDHILAFVKKYEGGGYLLTTTLDPDYHSYTGNQCAQCFLQLLIAWAREKMFESKMDRGKANASVLTWRRVLSRAFEDKWKMLFQFIIGFILALIAYKWLG